jgi:hypothetical protein
MLPDLIPSPGISRLAAQPARARNKGRSVITAAFAGAIPPAALYVLCVSYNLGYFYRRGASVYDAGWFAWLGRNATGWIMPNPAVIGGNFLAGHISPIFYLTSALASVVPRMPYAVWFSLWFSCWLPLLWLVLYSLLAGLPGLSGRGRVALASLLALNGLTLSMVGFPHVESFIPPLLLATLVACIGGTRCGVVLASLTFTLALMIREDAGLHAALIFTALAAIVGIRRRGTIPVIVLAGLGLAYGLSVLLAQRLLIPDGGRALGAVYLGHPMFSALTSSMLVHRMLYWATARAYIFVPLALLLFTAIRLHDRQLGLGVLVSLPWLALSLIAVFPMAGGLWDYYASPLVIPCFWPLLVARVAPGIEAARVHGLVRLQVAMAGFSCLIFVAIGVLPGVGYGGSHDRAPWRHLMPPGVDGIAHTEEALRDLEAAPGFATMILDDGVASLSLDRAMPGQFNLGLDPAKLDLTHASAFLRFSDPTPYAAAVDTRLGRLFPVCSPIEGTALKLCRRLQH